MTREEFEKGIADLKRWQYGDTESECSADYVSVNALKEFLKKVIDESEPYHFINDFTFTIGVGDAYDHISVYPEGQHESSYDDEDIFMTIETKFIPE